MKRIVVLATLAVISLAFSAGGDLPESERPEYVKDFHTNCLVKQRTDSFSKHLSEAQRSQYCQCAADRSAETVTLEEIGTAIRNQSPEPIKAHLEAVRRHCTERLMQKWLPKC